VGKLLTGEDAVIDIIAAMEELDLVRNEDT
jgi:hypothetical protein